MEDLDFEDLDRYLLSRSKIIHQVWFGVIPDKKKAAKAFEGLRKYRDSWLTKNSSWTYHLLELRKMPEVDELPLPPTSGALR